MGGSGADVLILDGVTGLAMSTPEPRRLLGSSSSLWKHHQDQHSVERDGHLDFNSTISKPYAWVD